jgi:hypothetical protein
MGIAGCRHRGSDIAATVVDFVFVLLFVLFLFLLLHADGVMMSHLFLAMDIGIMASSVAAAIVLSAVVPQVETKMASTMTTMAMMNEMRHGVPSTPPSYPCPRENKGKGNKGKGGGRRCRRWW